MISLSWSKAPAPSWKAKHFLTCPHGAVHGAEVLLRTGSALKDSWWGTARAVQASILALPLVFSHPCNLLASVGDAKCHLQEVLPMHQGGLGEGFPEPSRKTAHPGWKNFPWRCRTEPAATFRRAPGAGAASKPAPRAGSSAAGPALQHQVICQV